MSQTNKEKRKKAKQHRRRCIYVKHRNRIAGRLGVRKVIEAIQPVDGAEFYQKIKEAEAKGTLNAAT